MKTYFHIFSVFVFLLSFLYILMYKIEGMNFVINWVMPNLDVFPFETSFVVDFLSVFFLFTVSLISSLVLLYSYEYMKSDKFFNKFIIILFIFVLSMILLSMSANLFWMMIGWDGLGLSSFCLIFFFQNWKSLNSAMITFLMNRMGDLFFIFSIFWTLEFGTGFIYFSMTTNMFCLFMVLTSISKSAQMPFSIWLPLAMAAPTPVSALVHSSTLVTAGIFLLIRLSPFYCESLFIKSFFLLLSSMTLIMASTSAIFEFDLKKIIALSTLSHLGFMMMFIGMGNYEPALIHLHTHASFKSLLFMCSGMLIHKSFNTQDIRRLSHPLLLNQMFWIIMMTSILSMMGIPFLTGFYSKDIMVLTLENYLIDLYSVLVILISVMLTSIYSFRLIFFLSKSCLMATLLVCEKNHSTQKMVNIMFIGMILSVVSGCMIIWTVFPNEGMLDMGYMNWFSKIILFVFIFFGCLLGFSGKLFFLNNVKLKSILNNMWLMQPSLIGIIENNFYYNSWNYFFKVDSKGILDKFLFSIVEEMNFYSSWMFEISSFSFEQVMKTVMMLIMIGMVIFFF